jgi:hypothetical protein
MIFMPYQPPQSMKGGHNKSQNEGLVEKNDTKE